MIMNNDSFSIKAYGRSQLASFYFPHQTPASAWRNLRLWISRSAELSALLAALDYDGRQRTFTPAQVGAIVQVLGEP